jgi:hypothetical protein
MAADTVTQSRGRRATAGKRMSSLVGKAQDDDEAFWGHDTWGDENDEDYDVAEEKKEDLVDVFDSDFNDSEGDSSDEDNEDEEDGKRPSKRARTNAAASKAQKLREKLKQVQQQQQLSMASMSPSTRIMTCVIDPSLYPALYQRQQLLLSQARHRASEAHKPTSGGQTTTGSGKASSISARALLLKKKSKEKQKRSTLGTGSNAGMTLYVPSTAAELQTALEEWTNLANDYKEAVEKRERQMTEQQQESEQELKDQPSLENKIDSSTDDKQAVTFQLSPSLGPRSPDRSKLVSTSEIEAAASTPQISNLRQNSNAIIDGAHDNATSPSKHVGGTRRTLRTNTVNQSRAAATEAPPSPSNLGSPSRGSKTATANNNKEDRKNENDRKHIPTQEKMLIEAVQITELENAKWIHTRHRMAAQDTTSITGSKGGAAGAKPQGAPGESGRATNIIEKRHSKRGRYNTITFPELDSIPPFWKGLMDQKRTSSAKEKKGSTREKAPHASSSFASQGLSSGMPKLCYITQQPAKYRDPKTNLYYANVEAFREIRRRLDARTLPLPSMPAPAPSRTRKKCVGAAASSSKQAARLKAASFKTLKVTVAGEVVASPINGTLSGVPTTSNVVNTSGTMAPAYGLESTALLPLQAKLEERIEGGHGNGTASGVLIKGPPVSVTPVAPEADASLNSTLLPSPSSSQTAATTNSTDVHQPNQTNHNHPSDNAITLAHQSNHAILAHSQAMQTPDETHSLSKQRATGVVGAPTTISALQKTEASASLYLHPLSTTKAAVSSVIKSAKAKTKAQPKVKTSSWKPKAAAAAMGQSEMSAATSSAMEVDASTGLNASSSAPRPRS